MDIPLQDFDFSVLDDPEFKEDSVREEIVAPLLRALGYNSTGGARIVRSRALDHPYVQFGVSKKPVKIIPDYLLIVNDKPRWVLDAKGPREPVDDPEHVAQAYRLDIGFTGSPIRNVSRIGDDVYTGFGMNPNSEGEEYAVSFDFDGKILKQLLTALPEPIAKYVEPRLQGPPIQTVWMPGVTAEELPKATIWARRTTEFLENGREMYLPLRVTRIDPYSGLIVPVGSGVI